MEAAISLAKKKKKVLASLEITEAVSAIDAGIQKKNAWFWEYDFNNFK